MTRLGDLLHFGQLFEACGNNYFAQIAHILGNYCKDVKIFHFLMKSFLGNFYRLGEFLLVTLVAMWVGVVEVGTGVSVIFKTFQLKLDVNFCRREWRKTNDPKLR